MLEHVYKKATRHTGGTARELAYGVQQTCLDWCESQGDVNLRNQHQEGPAVHVLQRVGADHRGGHHRVFSALVFGFGYCLGVYSFSQSISLPCQTNVYPGVNNSEL